MAERPSELTWTPDGMVARVRLRGSAVPASPVLSRGTAFTLAERQALGLTGLLPTPSRQSMPVGLAFEGPFVHIGELASAHERAIEEFAQIIKAPDSVTAAVFTKLAWLDRQSTVILGDPTIRLALPG